MFFRIVVIPAFEYAVFYFGLWQVDKLRERYPLRGALRPYVCDGVELLLLVFGGICVIVLVVDGGWRVFRDSKRGGKGGPPEEPEESEPQKARDSAASSSNPVKKIKKP